MCRRRSRASTLGRCLKRGAEAAAIGRASAEARGPSKQRHAWLLLIFADTYCIGLGSEHSAAQLASALVFGTLANAMWQRAVDPSPWLLDRGAEAVATALRRRCRGAGFVRAAGDGGYVAGWRGGRRVVGKRAAASVRDRRAGRALFAIVSHTRRFRVGRQRRTCSSFHRQDTSSPRRRSGRK